MQGVYRKLGAKPQTLILNVNNNRSRSPPCIKAVCYAFGLLICNYFKIIIMREIKFRIWDFENMEKEKMQYCDEVKICDNGIFFEISKFDGYKHHNDTEHPKIMQFTGLKDKKGKEIYEGDILREVRLNNEVRYYKVWSEKGGFVINEFQDDFYRPTDKIQFWQGLSDMQTTSFVETLEVIGNIYESSELLERSSKADA